ncbi:hypothetical protein GCM10027422_35500 [Hymenobacter arcticus]
MFTALLAKMPVRKQAHHAADAVAREHVEGVVEARLRAQMREEIAGSAGYYPNEDAHRHRYVARGGRNGHQTHHGPNATPKPTTSLKA